MTGLPGAATSDPRVKVSGIGRLAGLRPRRRPGDGGEVSGADVDLVDALDPLGRGTVTAWLRDTPSPAQRQVRLRVLASFLRWLRATEPGLGLLAVTGAEVERYCTAALAGGPPAGPPAASSSGSSSGSSRGPSGGPSGGSGLPGRPLATATVARRRAVLDAFYAYAWRCGALRAGCQTGTAGTAGGREVPCDPPCDGSRDGGAAEGITREERRLLRRGVARLATGGLAAQAAAVALLDATGADVDALATLTPQDLCAVADGAGGDNTVVVLRTGRDDIAAFPVPAPARPLLRTLCRDRAATEPLLRRDDGEPADLGWFGAALIRAALAGGMPEERASRLHPRMLRAVTVGRLRGGSG
ncbi:hypothetical protein [Nonomuraea indica]|uniref:hypothetical protein n=1 Tax=Nonomuraea indica TaxID=1581193 RepID=UPI000C7C047D|nr:hypothetical protein [Nonomuraea indica]